MWYRYGAICSGILFCQFYREVIIWSWWLSENKNLMPLDFLSNNPITTDNE